MRRETLECSRGKALAGDAHDLSHSRKPPRVVMGVPLAIDPDVEPVQPRLLLHDQQVEAANSDLFMWEHEDTEMNMGAGVQKSMRRPRY